MALLPGSLPIGRLVLRVGREVKPEPPPAVAPEIVGEHLLSEQRHGDFCASGRFGQGLGEQDGVAGLPVPMWHQCRPDKSGSAKSHTIDVRECQWCLLETVGLHRLYDLSCCKILSRNA